MIYLEWSVLDYLSEVKDEAAGIMQKARDKSAVVRLLRVSIVALPRESSFSYISKLLEQSDLPHTLWHSAQEAQCLNPHQKFGFQ